MEKGKEEEIKSGKKRKTLDPLQRADLGTGEILKGESEVFEFDVGRGGGGGRLVFITRRLQRRNGQRSQSSRLLRLRQSSVAENALLGLG